MAATVAPRLPLSYEDNSKALVEAQTACLARGESAIKIGAQIPNLQYSQWITENGKEVLKKDCLLHPIIIRGEAARSSREYTLFLTIVKLGTPTCSNQLDDISRNIESLAKQRVTRVVVVTPDSPDIVKLLANKYDRRIVWIADSNRRLGSALNILMDRSGERGLGLVLKRTMSLLNSNGEVLAKQIEDDAACYAHTGSTAALRMVEAYEKEHRPQADASFSGCDCGTDHRPAASSS